MNRYIISNDFYIKDTQEVYLQYFDYFLSPGLPLAGYIKNQFIRRICYNFIRLSLIILYITKLYKLRYRTTLIEDNALIIFKGPGKWGNVIKLIKENETLKIIKKVSSHSKYLQEKKFYEKYKNNKSNIKLPKHKFLKNNTVEIDFINASNFQKLITNGTLSFKKSIEEYKKIRNEIKILYGERANLIHGDLWPGNLFISDKLYYLIDFGDSHINTYHYDLYVFLYSVLSTHNLINQNNLRLTEIVPLNTMLTDLMQISTGEIQKIERKFESYRKKRFPNLY